MSFVAEYTREQWEAQGDWNGVEDYITHVGLLFHEEYDESEDTPEEITEYEFIHEGQRCKKITRRITRPWRFYARDEEHPHIWYQEEEEDRHVSEDSIIVHEA